MILKAELPGTIE